MVTVHRAFGFRFVIYRNDHNPPHVHVLGQGGEVRIVLEGSKGVRVDWSKRVGRGDLRRLRDEALQQREHLIAEWGRMHDRRR